MRRSRRELALFTV